jgi:peptidoglycan hydrolase CwlO-like protein
MFIILGDRAFCEGCYAKLQARQNTASNWLTIEQRDLFTVSSHPHVPPLLAHAAAADVIIQDHEDTIAELTGKLSGANFLLAEKDRRIAEMEKQIREAPDIINDARRCTERIEQLKARIAELEATEPRP